MGMVYKLVAHEDEHGNWVSVAKKSADKVSVGGRKRVYRRLNSRGIAVAESIIVNDGSHSSVSQSEQPRNKAVEGREILVPLVTNGEVLRDHTGTAGIAAARERHRQRVAELPAVAMSLTRGDPAIPTEYV